MTSKYTFRMTGIFLLVNRKTVYPVAMSETLKKFHKVIENLAYVLSWKTVKNML